MVSLFKEFTFETLTIGIILISASQTTFWRSTVVNPQSLTYALFYVAKATGFGLSCWSAAVRVAATPGERGTSIALCEAWQQVGQ